MLRQIVQILASVVLARLLAPDDFGLLGMALVFIGVGQLFADFGLGAAIVRARSVEGEILSSSLYTQIL